MEQIRIGLFGFGKTGKAVASILLQSETVQLEWVIRRSHSTDHRSAKEFLDLDEIDDPATIYSLDEFLEHNILSEHPVDIIIDFSGQQGILQYGSAAAAAGTTVITAVSHYDQEQEDYMKDLAESIAILWSPNITVGVNFLILASRILKQIAPYTDIEIIEEHFKRKPELSGTAKKLARALDVPDEQIKMIRAGGIIGKHEALFGFPFQTVRLTHESISREAFGNGALFAAVNMKDAAPGMYTMEQLMQPYFSLS